MYKRDNNSIDTLAVKDDVKRETIISLYILLYYC
jgi:hypothetical protein